MEIFEYLIVSVLFLVFVCLVVWSQWGFLRQSGLEHKERITLNIEMLKVIVQLLGGVILLVGIRATVSTLTVTEDGLFSDRHIRANEKLAKHEDEIVRIGAIFALERIAHASQKDHWPIMESLATFVRLRSPKRQSSEQPERCAADIQAILGVIGRRNPDFDRPENFINLSDTNLAEAGLVNTKLSTGALGGFIMDRADLRCANLMKVALKDAQLIDTDVRFAKFYNTDVSGADLTGVDVRDTDIREMIGLRQDQLCEMRGNRDTLLPRGLLMPAEWLAEDFGKKNPCPW